LSLKALSKKSASNDAPEEGDENVVQRKTGAFQKMLKKFLKKAKTEEVEEEDDEF
jgi:hypothetical protein